MSTQTVLIIEDSHYLAESLVDALELHDYRALMANTGRDGVVLANEEQPDLILLDIRLPDIDGYEVYRRIRELEWGKTAQIIILTASESIKTISKNIDLPIDCILFKPDWSLKAILEKVDSLLQD